MKPITLSLLAGYSVTGYGNSVTEVIHDRCARGKFFGLDREDVALSDLAAFARDHKCPGEDVPVLRGTRQLVVA